MEQADYVCEAFGIAGDFTVEVLSGSDGKFLLTIGSSAWDFDFELVNAGAVSELAGFLRFYVGRREFAELVIGSFNGASVEIVKDDEFEDRLILRARGNGVLVYFKMVAGATTDFASAVSQAAEDFEL